jgi:hypothetical protein
MIIKLEYIENYARTKVQEERFHSSRQRYEREEIITRNAGNFLTYLVCYEKYVPKRIRRMLSSFEETRNLAMTLLETARIDTAKKRGR